VLIVDEDTEALATFAFGLLAMGFQPLTASTSEEAFERACRFHPGTVVTAATLPGGSGLDLTRRLREDTRTNDTGIIVLSGPAGATLRRQADEAGCDRLVAKPCMPDALALEILDVLRRRDSSDFNRPPVNVPTRF
jgi:DNA-binding response OmpR family regulator